MDKANEHIELLYRYVDGELTAEQSLFVEQQLATNEEWQEVYEGLLFAEKHDVDVQTSLSRLEKQVNEHKPVSEKAPIIPIDMRRWATIAAAISGFVLLSYAAIKAINSGQFGNAATDHSVYSSRPSVYPEDQIQIIPSRKKTTKRTQVFEAEEVEQIAAEQEVIITDTEELVAMAQSDSEEGAASYSARVESEPVATLEVAQKSDQFSRPGSYSDLLARYGYIELNSELQNRPRGAHEISLPANHYNNFIRNAMSESQVFAFKEEFEADYVARFPFSGVVKATFTVDETGEPTNFKVLESPSDDATKVAKKLFFEKAEWQVPLSAYEKATSQEVTGTVSFGNSIFIKLDFEE